MLTYTTQFSSVFLEIGAEDLSPRWRWGTMIETTVPLLRGLAGSTTVELTRGRLLVRVEGISTVKV